MIAILLTIATVAFALKDGKGNEKFLCLLPLGLWGAFTLVNSMLSTPNRNGGSTGPIPGGVILLMVSVVCVAIVARIRSNSLARALSDIEKGNIVENKKFEL